MDYLLVKEMCLWEWTSCYDEEGEEALTRGEVRVIYGINDKLIPFKYCYQVIN